MSGDVTPGRAEREALEATFRRTYALHPNDFKTKYEKARDEVMAAADAYVLAAQERPAADDVAGAIDVLFRHRHELTPDALRSLQDIWACGSAARYGQPYETWFTDDLEFYANHDTATCEAENGEQADEDFWAAGEDGYPDSKHEAANQ